MSKTIFANQALTSDGWRQNVGIEIDEQGVISDISDTYENADHSVGVLLPALSNVHSHSFQRAMAGLAERRGDNPYDDFWTWRKVMYRFLEILSPDDIEVIAAQVQLEMLESGFASMAEFHYLHHAPGGKFYDSLDELSVRHFEAAKTTGVGYTHLPVLYTYGGLDGRPLQGGQMRFGCDIDQYQKLFSKISDRFSNLPSDYVLGVAPHSLRAVSVDGLRASIEIGVDGPIHIHAAEQIAEVDEVTKVLGKTPIRWLLDNMPVDKHWCVIHATHMDQAEIRDLAKTGAVAGLCPITEANLGDGVFEAAQFFSHDGSFGIGADSNVKIALSEELRMLETSQRLRDKRRVILTDDMTRSNGRYLYEKAATGGARAIGRNSGQIKIGALADLVALNDKHHNVAALKEDLVLDSWIFASSSDVVSDVWSAGRHVVKEGSHINHEAITSKFSETIKQLRQSL
jgi:formimidoylglutamate deiminase